jgi:hypothetical protein
MRALQGMANLIWSFGRLQHPADALVAAIVTQVRLGVLHISTKQTA